MKLTRRAFLGTLPLLPSLAQAQGLGSGSLAFENLVRQIGGMAGISASLITAADYEFVREYGRPARDALVRALGTGPLEDRLAVAGADIQAQVKFIATLLYTGEVMLLFIASVATLVMRNKAAFGTAPQLPREAIFLLVLLFVLQIPTTGLYDTAYLVRHLCSSDLITDRATLGAACQVAAVFAGGAALMRWPQLENYLIGFAILVLLAGTVAVVFYPYQTQDVTLFYTSKAANSVGIGLATAVIVSRVVGASQGNKIIMLAPAFIIMFGTEVGIELLEIVFQSAKLGGWDDVGAYQIVFLAQTLAVLLAVGLILKRGLDNRSGGAAC